jgi:hypothetical protein
VEQGKTSDAYRSCVRGLLIRKPIKTACLQTVSKVGGSGDWLGKSFREGFEGDLRIYGECLGKASNGD